MIVVKKKLDDEEDRGVLIKLADIYTALMDVVNIPLTVTATQEDFEMIRGRINSHTECVSDHLNLLARINSAFDYITELSNSHSRIGIKNGIDSICNELRNYAEVVREHRVFWEDQSFLSYPSLGEGQVHYAEGNLSYTSSPFNPSKSYVGLVREIDELRSAGVNFSIRSSVIPLILFNDGYLFTPDDKTLAGRIMAAREQIIGLGCNLDFKHPKQTVLPIRSLPF